MVGSNQSYTKAVECFVVSCMYLDGGMGGGVLLLTSLLSFLFYYLYSWASMLYINILFMYLCKDMYYINTN